MYNNSFRALTIEFETVAKRTRQEVGNKIHAWPTLHKLWEKAIDVYFAAGYRLETINSLAFWRLVELDRHLFWTQFCVLSGNYYSCIRELRFIFESWLQADYMDRKFPQEHLYVKTKKLAEVPYGSKLIPPIKEKLDFEKLYGDLCKYVHPTQEELKSLVEEGKVSERYRFQFNRGMFEKCLEFTKKVADAVFLLLLTLNPNVAENIRKDKEAVDLFSILDLKCSFQKLVNDPQV